MSCRVRRIVVLGTGTGVGKTFFTVALARAVRRLFSDDLLLATKPIETGRSDRPPPFADAAALEQVSSGAIPDPHPCFGFLEPISPHLAAARAGVAIDLNTIKTWLDAAEVEAVRYHTLRYSDGQLGGCASTADGRGSVTNGGPSTVDRNACMGDSTGASATHSDFARKTAALWSLVETAGGVFSPLNATATNLSLAVSLEPAIWIVVAPDALGVLHDLTATLTAMRAKARMPDFVVLSAAREPDASTATNADELARLGIATPVAVLGRGTTSSLAELVDRLSNDS